MQAALKQEADQPHQVFPGLSDPYFQAFFGIETNGENRGVAKYPQTWSRFHAGLQHPPEINALC